MKLTVTAVSRPITQLHSSLEFHGMLAGALERREGSDLIVLPELFNLSLCSLDTDIFSVHQGNRELDRLLRDKSTVMNQIITGSYLDDVDGVRTHVSRTYYPDGQIVTQPKNILTQWEAVDWQLEAQTGLAKHPVPEIGVLVCYDVEFPEAARKLAESGVKVLCVPAWTETEHGFNRVRQSCIARAIENQIYVIHAALAGGLGVEPCPRTYGSSAIIAPPIPLFPANGIIAETPLNEPGFVTAELDLNLLDEARNSGDVRNWNDRNASDWHWIN